MKEKIFISQRS